MNSRNVSTPPLATSPNLATASAPAARESKDARKGAPAEGAPPAARSGCLGILLSNLDKVLYPATGFTKSAVIRYYTLIAPAMLPHLAGRPITTIRFPDVEYARVTERTSAYAKAVAQRFAAETPDLVTAKMTKSLRTGKVVIHWSQNNPSKTTVAPSSLRGRDRLTVSTPITWDAVRACTHPGGDGRCNTESDCCDSPAIEPRSVCAHEKWWGRWRRPTSRRRLRKHCRA